MSASLGRKCFHFGYFIALTLGVCSSSVALSSISLGISGSGSTSNAGLEKYQSISYSANMSFGLGDHFRIGLTHRRAFEKKTGLKKAQLSDSIVEYFSFNDDTRSIANSIDFTIILYTGKMSPFIFGGIARRDYDTVVKYREARMNSKMTLFPVPTYGFGIGFYISRNFNFKITQTFSPGVRIIIQDNQEKLSPVNDSYLQAGVTYKI